jgi:pimeloyl-ACP methyl ester carboxylesterase
MRFVLDGSVENARSFISFVGTLDVPSIEPLIDSAASRGVRGMMISGADDRLSQQWMTSARDELVRGGVRVKWEEVPGVGHWYPADFGERLQQGLDFLLST